MEQQRPQQPQQDAREQVAADQRVAEAAGEQPAPRDDRLRPVPAHVRLERQVEQPGDRRHEQRVADRQQQQADLLERGEVAGEADPDRDVQAEDGRRQPQRAAAVGRARPRSCGCARNSALPMASSSDQDADDAGGLLAGRAVIGPLAVRMRPGADQLEEHRLAAVGGGLHAQRQASSRPGPGPRGPGIGGGQRVPQRLGRLELRAVEPGGGEQRVPVRFRRRGQRRLLLLRRQHLQEVEPALRVEPDVHHAGDRGGGLPGAHDTWRQHVARERRSSPAAAGWCGTRSRRPAAGWRAGGSSRGAGPARGDG